MSTCPICGHPNPPSVGFCGNCGISLTNPCPHCGATVNPPGAVFCIICYGSLEEPEKKSRKRLGLVVVVLGILLLLVSCLAVWQFGILNTLMAAVQERTIAPAEIKPAEDISDERKFEKVLPSDTLVWTSTPAYTVTPVPTQTPIVTEPAQVETLPTVTEAVIFTPSVTPSFTPSPTPLVKQVLVPAGEFSMGISDALMESVLGICRSESYDCPLAMFDGETPEHLVYLDAFKIDVYEVTNDKFAVFVAETGYITEAEVEGRGMVEKGDDWQWLNGTDWRHPNGPDSDITALAEQPVVQISWNDANVYCEWAGGRLPTDAEWEKAARGTDGRLYPWGNDFRCDGANLDDETTIDSFSTRCDDGWARTAPVGSYEKGASPYGVQDMAGNVREWTSDWYAKSYYSVSPYRNPAGPSREEFKSTRGGSWFTDKTWARITDRRPFKPTYRSNFLGFRCARDEN